MEGVGSQELICWLPNYVCGGWAAVFAAISANGGWDRALSHTNILQRAVSHVKRYF